MASTATSSSNVATNRQREQAAARRPSRVPKRWHAQDNSALRSHVVGKLRKLFPALDHARLSGAATATTTTATTGASVVQRLEWMLYNAAHSRREYANECSLERRVQALVTQQLGTATGAGAAAPRANVSRDHKPAATPSTSLTAPNCQRSSCSKRPRRASLSAVSIDEPSLFDGATSPATAADSLRRAAAPGAYKRRRRESFHAPPNSFAALAASLAAPPAASASAAVVASAAASSTLFLNNDLNLVAQVFAYLDGADALRARAVNQFLAAHAPSMVHSLTLDARVLSAAGVRSTGDNGFVTALLLRCTGLHRLVVMNSRNAPVSSSSNGGVRSDLPRGYSAPTVSGGGSAPQQLHGYEIVAQATAAFHRRACPMLETLELRAPFEFATESDTIVECLGALAHRHANQRPSGASSASATMTTMTAPLKRLVLDSTFLGDARLAQLALLLERTAPYFRDLEALALRGNFAGEAGCHALFAALHWCPRLHSLDLSGNILTDTDAVALAHAVMRAGACAPGSSSDSGGDEWDASQQPLAALQHLALHENFIGLDGFAALSSAVCTRLLALGDEEMDARAGARSLVRVSCSHNCAPLADATRLFQF